MKDKDKTKEQLLYELAKLRQRCTELEASEPERKRAEEALKKSQEKLVFLLKNIPDFIITVDCNHEILMLNRGVPDVTVEQAIGTKIYNYVEHGHHEIMRKSLDKVFQTGMPEKYEVFGMGPKGPNTVWYETRVFPNKTDDQIISVTLISSDITERKKAEEIINKRTHELSERVKELNCLYGIGEIIRKTGITTEQALEEAVQFIPSSWQYPEITGGCVTFEDKKYKTKNFKETKWKQKADIIVDNKKAGAVEVCYLEEKPEIDEGPFLKEERALINSISVRLGQFIEHKRAEEALRESEEKWLSLTENTDDTIVVTDNNDVIRYISRTIPPTTPEGVVGKTVYEYVSREHHEIMKESLKNVYKTGNPDSYEVTLDMSRINPKIGTLWFNTKVVPIKTDKEVAGVIMIATDITERRKAEEMLRKSKEAYRELADSIADVFFAMDKDLRYTYWNRASEELIGIAAKDAIGKSILEIFPDNEETRRAIKGYHEVLKTKQPKTFISEYQLGGKDFFFEISAYPSREGISVFVKDITERKQAEEQIKAALKEKEVMLKEIHHRVKNNMQIMSSLLKLQFGETKSKKIQEMLRTSQSRIRSMALIHERLYQSKDFARIDFTYYIRSLTVYLFHSYRVDSNIVRLKTDVRDVHLDINRAIPCGLIVNELVSNSLKYAFPEGKEGEISIKFYSNKQGKIILVVRDKGIGFPEDIDFRNTKSFGMQVVNDLVEQLRGTIELDRKGGTTFKIVF